uniref:Glycine N-acyltransferase-like protein n=1 Tax=Maylandia zebra TaxID=106582 RepID=A0A3P9BP87_9CICH
MKVLSRDELQVAEGVLLKHLPKSYKVYGFLYGINRNKPTTLEVVVDAWPDFKVIICRPDPENKRASIFMKKVTYYSTDEQSLRKMLTDENAVDWSTYFMIGGLDVSHAPVLKQVSCDRRVKYKTDILVHLLYLQDTNYLHMPAINRYNLKSICHMKYFGGDEKGYRKIENLISNFPSCCITDSQGQPVSWILVCDYCALGMLYTLPEHRGKGYAKIVISTLAKKLHAEGYPVFCYIEEDNVLSYKLFKNMGFIEDPSYRAAWLEFNFLD